MWLSRLLGKKPVALDIELEKWMKRDLEAFSRMVITRTGEYDPSFLEHYRRSLNEAKRLIDEGKIREEAIGYRNYKRALAEYDARKKRK